MPVLICSSTILGCGFTGDQSEFTRVNDVVSEAELGDENIFICPKCGGTFRPEQTAGNSDSLE